MPQLVPGSAFSFLLADVNRLFARAFDEALEKAGFNLTSGEARALAYITTYDGRRQTVLAGLMSVEPMTLSGYINRLQKQRLVTLMPDRTDRRAKIIRPTENGRAVFEQVRPIAQQLYDRAIKGLSPALIKAMEEGLAVMRTNLGGKPIATPPQTLRVA